MQVRNDRTPAETSTTVPIDRLLPANSPRVTREDLGHTRVLAASATPLPPILVHRSTMRVIDGTHRVGAARMRGETVIEVCYFDGSEPEAFELAVRVNIADGLLLTHGERITAIESLLALSPRRSDRSIAATVGLSATTVAGIRARLPGDQAGTERRVGRDGRIRPVNNAEGRERIRELIRRTPDASLRQIAREAGASPATVREVRRGLLGAATGQVFPATVPAARAPAFPAVPGLPGAVPLIEFLSNDPSLRYTEDGRTLLRRLAARLLRPHEWRDLPNRIPPHTVYLVAELAEECAREWSRFASELKAHGKPTV
jgi:hypothetical protein